MSKSKQLTDLMEEDNASASSPRRSSRIATRRISSCDEIPSSPAKTKSRRPSLTLDNNGTPGKITRSKRSSLSLESDVIKDNESNSSSPHSKKSGSPGDSISDGPAKRTRRRGSLTNSTQDENEASTPIPNRVVTRRLSGRRSMSKSPSRENSSPTLENLPKASTPKRRGRKPSVTEKVIPLEAIEETELNKADEDESNSSKTKIVDLTDDVGKNVDDKISNLPKNDNLETILESSILDSQEGEEIEKNLTGKLANSSKNRISDAGNNKSFKKDESIEIVNLNDTSLNKSLKNKTLNCSQNESVKHKSVEISVNDDTQSPTKSKVTSKRNKTAEIVNLDEDSEDNKNDSLNKSKSKNKSIQRDTSNIENAENDLINVLNSSRNISGLYKLQNMANSQSSDDHDPFKLVMCEGEPNVNLSIEKTETLNKSNESNKENQHKNPDEITAVNKESQDLFSEPMEIDDYPPDTSDEIIAKCVTPNNSVMEQSGGDNLNSSVTQKEDIVVLSPIISSIGKRNITKPSINSNISMLYDSVCANSTPKRVTLNPKENEHDDVDSNTPSKTLKDDAHVSIGGDSVKDKSKKSSLVNSVDLNDSKRNSRKSLNLNKSGQKPEETLNLSGDFNESKTKVSRKSKDLNGSDSNEKSSRKLRSSTSNTSNTSCDENAKEDSVNLEASVTKSPSKEKLKTKSQSLLDAMDSDQNDDIFDEKSKRQSKNLLISFDSKRKSKNLSQSIDKDQSIEKSPSEEKSKRKSKNLSQSIDKDGSIDKSASEESTKKKFKDLLQSTNKEENIKKSSEETPKEKSKCLSNLIDVDETDDDEDDQSVKKSKNIDESYPKTNVTSKSANLSSSSGNESISKSNDGAELEATINKFVETYQLMDEDDERHSLLDDQASEGEEDTPSENSCDIPVDGESLGSSDSEKTVDESYEHDSFIVSDEETELLSGNEYDLNESKVTPRRLKLVKNDDDDDVDNDNVKTNSKTEEKKQESDKTVEKDFDLQNTSTKPCSELEPSSEKKKASQKTAEEDSDLENMSIKPYCGLDPPSVASSRESLSEADKIEVSNKKTENLINISIASPITTPRKSLNTSFTGSLNISVVEDKENTTRRSRTTSLLVQEQFQNYNVENVCDHISKVVNMVYSDSKKGDVDIALNVSLEFTEKRKSTTTDTPNATLNLELPAEILSSDVISVASSDEDTSKKAAAKEVVQKDSSTDSNMSDDIDEDLSSKYYESRLISKEEDMKRQLKSGVPKLAKPVFPYSSDESVAEEQQNEPKVQDFNEKDARLSKSDKNDLGVTGKVKARRGKKRNRFEKKAEKTKILQATKLTSEIKVPTGKATKRPIVKEISEIVPSKKMKVNEENTIKKKKQKLQPSKNLSDGDSLQINYFPSKILNTIVNVEKSNKKPKVVPSKSANENSWNCQAASPVKPYARISKKKKNKVESKINPRDFKSITLNDNSRNRRVDMESFLRLQSKLQQKARP